MARQTINIGSAANDGNGDTLRVGATKINENFQEVYAQLGGGDSGVSLTTVVSLVDSGLRYNGATFDTVLTNTEGAAKLVFTLPDSDGEVTINTATQTLTNKTLNNPHIDSAEIVDMFLYDGDGGNYYKIKIPTLGSNINVNFPTLAAEDTITFNAATQTLTNKTLTEPIIGTSIKDTNTAEIVKFTATGSAVNEITVANAASGNRPTISASGTENNVGLSINPKGDGAVVLGKVAYSSKQISSGDTTDSDTFIVMNPSGTTSFPISNGTINGELKVLLNRGTATATLTSSNFAFGSTLDMAPNALVQMIWESVELNWHLLGTDSSGPNITIA